MTRKYTPEEARTVFFSNISANEQPHPRLGTPCHEWRGRRNEHGYGTFGHRCVLTHRLAWEYANGRDPGKGCVLHHCDNPPCCNPEHLYLGDQKQNAADREARGRGGSRTHPERQVRGDRHWTRTNPENVPRGDKHMSRTHPESVCRGEKHGRAKYTEAQILEVRRLADKGVPQTEIAALFGMSSSAVSRYVLRQGWGHMHEDTAPKLRPRRTLPSGVVPS